MATVSAWSAEQSVRFIRSLRAKITSLVGDDADTIRDTIEGEVEIEAVAGALIKAYGETKAQAAGLAAYAKEIAEKQREFEDRAQHYRDLIFEALTAAEQQQVRTLFGTASISAGRDRTVVHDESILPAWMFRSEPDLAQVKAALTAGEVVPGAAIEKGPPSLTIRVK